MYFILLPRAHACYVKIASQSASSSYKVQLGKRSVARRLQDRAPVRAERARPAPTGSGPAGRQPHLVVTTSFPVLSPLTG